MDHRHIYDLSFVPHQGSKEINPQIVLSISERNLEVFRTKLHFITARIGESVEKYLGFHSVFTQPDKDLFGNYTFGYDRCGYMNINEGGAHLHFELGGNANIYCISITIRVVLQTLNNMLIDEEIRSSNHPQFIEIITMCRKDIHGHSMGGYISPELGAWLKKQGEQVPQNEISMFRYVYLPDVGEVMRQTWNKITNMEIDKNECRAIIYPDGRFSLICPGNACDVSIYPDQSHGDAMGTESVEFSCHNLDGVAQQITLLVGIAKLCELARNDK